MSVPSNLVEFDGYLRYLEFVYFVVGFRIKSSILTNFSRLYLTITMTLVLLSLFICSNVAFFEKTPVYVKVQHIWCTTAFVSTFIRFTNRLQHWDQIFKLVQWFRDIHTRSYGPEYVAIVNNHLKGMYLVLKRAIP